MAGHSKWANIQHRKRAQDARRGKVFTKLIREITVAAKRGADPAGNPALRLAIDRALAANMPKDTITRAIRRGSGELGADNVEEIRYEGYGPGGVAIMVDCVTDNRQRTVAEVRHAFSKHGGNLGSDGSVAYLFQRQGVIGFDIREHPELEERIFELALEAGASDVQTRDGWCEVITDPEHYDAVDEALRAAGLEAEVSELTMRAMTRVAVDDAHAESLANLLEALEQLDDVQEVYHNAELPESETLG